MNTTKIERESKAISLVALVVGMILLAIGIVLSVFQITIISNNKALIGLSFVPLAVAFIYFFKYLKIKNTPEKMQETIITETDERLVASKNEADAIAFKILQGALFLAYLGLTLMFPEQIFESAGWWFLTILLFISFITQAILHLKRQEK